MVIHRGEWGPFVRIESDKNQQLHLRLVEDEKGSSTPKEIHDFVQNHFKSLSLDDVQIIKGLRLGKRSAMQIIKMVGHFFSNGFRTDTGLMEETYVYAFKKEIEETQATLKTFQLSSDHQVVKKQTEKAANKKQTPLSICGEIASDPRYTPLLIGLGLRELSFTAHSYSVIKHTIRLCHLKSCQALSKKVLTLSSSTEIEALLSNYYGQLVPEDDHFKV